MIIVELLHHNHGVRLPQNPYKMNITDIISYRNVCFSFIIQTNILTRPENVGISYCPAIKTNVLMVGYFSPSFDKRFS